MIKNTNIKNVLVTGGSGFIGSNFISQSCIKFKDIKFTNIDNLSYAVSRNTQNELEKFDNYSFHLIDICDLDAVRKILEDTNYDLVVHFAAESHVDNSISSPQQFIQTNIIGTYNLINTIKEINFKNDCNILFHHISTDEVFGSLDINDPEFTELSNLSPSSPYSASKTSSDLLVEAWGKTYGMRYLITNCSNNFGPRQYTEKLIPKVIMNCLQGKKIPVYGSGKNIRDWLHVNDHIDAIHALYANGKFINERFNIGGGYETSNIEIIQLILEIMKDDYGYSNSNNLIEFVRDRSGHDFRYAIDNSKLKIATGWQPSHSFQDHMKRTIDWYISHATWWDE
jgi:dTDP-glucose 4,6-dehydratase